MFVQYREQDGRIMAEILKPIMGRVIGVPFGPPMRKRFNHMVRAIYWRDGTVEYVDKSVLHIRPRYQPCVHLGLMMILPLRHVRDATNVHSKHTQPQAIGKSHHWVCLGLRLRT